MLGSTKIALGVGIGGIVLGFLGASAFSCRPGKSGTPAPSVDITSEAMRERNAHLQQPKSVVSPQGTRIALDTAGPVDHGKPAQSRDFTQMKFNIPVWMAPVPKLTAAEPPPKHHGNPIRAESSENVGGGMSSLTKSWDRTTKAGKVGNSHSEAIIGTS